MASKLAVLLPVWLLPLVALGPVDAWADDYPTETNVTVLSPATVGQAVQITATVTNALAPNLPGSTNPPTGFVSFTFASGPIGNCQGKPISPSGMGVASATCFYAPPSTGTFTITGTYAPGAGFQPSSPGSTQLTVVKAATSIAVSVTPSAVLAGQQVTITAQVSYPGGIGTPTGAVTFTQVSPPPQQTLCSNVSLSNTAAATCSYTFTQAGPLTIAATYSGDPTFLGSVGSNSLTVGAGTATVNLNCSGSPQISQPLTCIAIVSGSGTPTGTVAFSVNGSTWTACAAVELASGQAQCVVSCPQLGTCSITASYSGDASNTKNTGSTSLQIQPAEAMPYSGSYAVGGVTSSSYYASQVITVAAKFCQAPPLAAPTGTATFSDGNTVLGSVPANASTCLANNFNPCAASTSVACAYWTAPFSIGVHSVTAAFSGDSNYGKSTTPAATGTFTVQSTQTGGSIASSPANPVPFGVPVVLGAIFLPANTIAPTGTVTFYFQGSMIGTAPVDNNGHAQIPLPAGFLAIGTYSSFTAAYGGDANYQQSTTGPLPITITQDPVSLVLAGTAYQNGQPAGVTAVPVVTSGSATPTGMVDFTDANKTPISGCTGVALQNGQAQCKIAQAQSAIVNVSYRGDALTRSALAAITLAAGAVTPGFYVESAPAKPILGATVTVDTRLFGPPGLPAPTGTVKFTMTAAALASKPVCVAGSNPPSLCSPAVGSDGHALLVLGGANTPALGAYSVSAVYSGDANYQGGSPFWPSPYVTPNITVVPDPTLIVVASAPGQYGQPLSLNAAVEVPSPGTASANGTINWLGAAGSVVASCKVTPQSTTVQCPIPSLDTFRPTVTYVPADGNTAGSSLMVPSLFSPSSSKAFAGVYVTASPAAASYGTPVTITAALIGAPNVAPPGGTVTFYDNGAALGPPATVTAGSAALTLGSLAVGSHNITAAYSGDGNYVASPAANNTVALTVTKAATEMAVTALPVPSQLQVYQPVTLGAAVTVLGPGTAVQDGTVDFTAGAAPVPGCTGVTFTYYQNDQNTPGFWCTTSFSQLGTLSVGASYSGSANYAAVAGSLQVTVGKEISGCTAKSTPTGIATSCGFSISADFTTVVYGAPVYLRGLLFGTPSPTGTVTFFDAGAALGTTSVGAGGWVSLTVPSGSIPALGVGEHTITAIYNGDGNFLPSDHEGDGILPDTSASVSVNVTKADTYVDLYMPAPEADHPIPITASVMVRLPGFASPSGTIDFTNSGQPISNCTGLAVQSGSGTIWGMLYGSVTCTATFSQLAGVFIAAHYNGDARTLENTSQSLSMGQAAAGFHVTANNVSLPYGAGVAIWAFAMGFPTPTGTVTFKDGTTTLATVPVGADSSAYLAVPSGSIVALEPGKHTITATYSGDSVFQSVTDTSLVLTITPASTAVDLYSVAPQVDQPLALNAAVRVLPPGVGTPTGTVDFTNGGKPIAGCTGLPMPAQSRLTPDGKTQYWPVACTASFSQLTGVSIVATYNGDVHTAAVASLPVNFVVGKALPGLFLSADNPSLPYGAGLVLGALAMGTPTPTGTVTFSDGSTALATVPIGADGTAPLAVPSASLAPLEVGTHTIAAAYSGDANFQSAAAAPLTVTINKADIGVSIYAPAPQVDQPLTLKAAITVSSPGQATPTGTVDFSNAGAPIPGCTGVSLASGLASNGMSYWPAFCNTTFSKISGLSIAAAYNGDAHTAAGSSPATPLTVGKAVAGIYAASSPAAPVFGVPIVVRALLLGASGMPAPTGVVTFSENGAAIGAGAIGADGYASLNLPAGGLAAGQHLLTASWPGDGNYSGPAAASLTIVVGKASTTTTLSASFGMPLTATVSVMAPGAGSPGGSVQFFVNGTLAGTALVTSKNGAFTAAAPAGAWTGNAWAVYQGDANFAGSASPSVAVTPAAVVSIVADRNPATAGQSITFTVNVTPASGTTVPGGRVQIAADGVLLGTVSLTAGAAGYTTAANALAVGSHTVTASYSGDSVYPAASATLLEVVAKSVISLTLTASPATAVYGQSVTLTAQLSASSGNVQFSDAGAPIGAGPIVAGAATFTISTLPAGSHTIAALWTGDATSSAASSSPLPVSIGKAQTATRLGSTGMVLTAAVGVVAPGAGTPTGTVRFLDAATNSVFAGPALAGGTASAPQPATADSIVAVYSGDANFAGSISTPLTPLAAANAASFAADAFAPDEIVTLFGTSLAPITDSATANPSPVLGGSSVAITDSAGVRRAANLLFVSPSQASIVMPTAVPDGPAVIAITNASGVTFTAAITVSRVAPGLFTADGSGKGTPVGQTIRVHADGSQDPPQDLTAGPIDLGVAGDSVYLLLYGTGIRHQTTAAASVGIVTDLPVAFAGAQPSVAGLDQVNLLLPPSLHGAGQATLTLTLNGVASNPVTLMFR